jgi:hypothetical protein
LIFDFEDPRGRNRRQQATRAEGRATMLSFEDCLGLCDLSEEEIQAIARSKHLPEIVAAELGHTLVHSDEGTRKIKAIMRQGIREAGARGDDEDVRFLRHALAHFCASHPDRAGTVHDRRLAEVE